MESTTLAAFSIVSATSTARTTGPSLPLITSHNSGARHVHPLLLARGLGGLGAAGLPVNRRRLQCLPSSSPSFSGGGAGFGGYSGGSGGGGGGGSDSGDSKSKLGAGAGDGGVSVPSSDIIVLNVGGMTCGGCSASVKKILESQPQVASASVNLTTETAIVWPVPEARSVPDWQKTLGETLANHLTNCGFQSTPRDEVPEDIAGEIAP
ncbi:hypothetical protein BRARA_H01265 [Brassica rapa]|uniref:HMA domain-containing protein n=1 Tax=Brassica campestris TaxID=3711 RepID=A0A397YHQ4_BRACM|nr:hypothetical protein BRARA_H01265 [Brassica rapa]